MKTVITFTDLCHLNTGWLHAWFRINGKVDDNVIMYKLMSALKLDCPPENVTESDFGELFYAPNFRSEWYGYGVYHYTRGLTNKGPYYNNNGGWRKIVVRRAKRVLRDRCRKLGLKAEFKF